MPAANAIDWRVSAEAADRHFGDVAIQGNLDPAVLLADPETIRRHTREMLDAFAHRSGYIANLGHGIHRDTPPEHLAVFVDTVRGRR